MGDRSDVDGPQSPHFYAWAAVDAGTTTEEQKDMVKGMAKGLADGPKANRAKAAAAAAAAGRQ